MNNGVENNQVLNPGVVPAAPAAVPTNPAVAGVPNGAVPNVVPAPVSSAPNMPETIPAAMVIRATPEVQPETTPVPETTPEEVAPETKQKRGPSFGFLLFILLIGAIGFAFYTKSTYERQIVELRYQCTPASESREEVALDVNSSLVQDLYQKVATTIREDYAQPEWNDTMRVYLAFRQVPEYKMYDSNCNLFSNGNMEPYTCEVSTLFVPKAFKRSSLELEWKKLFGETTPMPKINAHLQIGCVGGFEYIPERDEYVQGYCKNPPTTTIKAKKTLKEAVTSNNMIILTEEVEYYGTDKVKVPSYLVSGTYYYTFRLDLNYNYVLISKKYNQKY